MVSHHPAKIGVHMHCGSGNMLLVVEEQCSICCRLNLLLTFISKAPGILCLHARHFAIQGTVTKIFINLSFAQSCQRSLG